MGKQVFVRMIMWGHGRQRVPEKVKQGSVTEYFQRGQSRLTKWTACRKNGYLGDRTSFDAFGLRRTADWKAMSLSSLYSFKSLISERGYTGHEQLDAVGLIHMNGRVGV